jgi:polyisoprenoid-binding protein YceI
MAILAAAVRRFAAALVATVCIAAMWLQTPALAAAVSYAVDPGHTFATFEIDHLGLSTARGRFDRTSGSIVLDPAAGEGRIEIVIDTASVDTGVAKRDEHLRAAAFFNVAMYPTMTYVATKLHFDGNRLTGADGELTMLGKTLPVSIEVTRFDCGLHPIRKQPACGADAVTQIRRSDWGMTKYVPIIGDDVTLRIGVEAFALP